MYEEFVYIASPLRGDVDRNIENAMRYCEQAIKDGGIPLAPHAMYRGIFNDEIPEQHAAALRIGQNMLEKCSRMWVCGDRISEGMRGEIDLAQKKGIRRLLSLGAKHYGHSLTNAATIYLQKPDTQYALPYQEWHKLGFRVTDYKNSVKIWAAVPSADGSHTVYRMQALYDISQTDCPANQYERIMATPYSHLDYSELYATMKTTSELTGFPVKEVTGVSTGYQHGEIFISARAHPAQQLACLADSYARGIVEQTSQQPLNIRNFEANSLSFLLQSRLRIPDQLMTAGPDFSAENLSLNAFGRVQRMLRHTENGLQSELKRQNLDIDAPMRTAQKENQFSNAQKEINRNFTQEL